MPIDRIEVLDHKAFGKLVAQWSLQPQTRPATLQELKDACGGILLVPERIKNITFVDSDLETFVIRVPNREMVEESEKRFGTAPNSSGYPWPAFYDDLISERSPPALETLYNRIADYTISQCF